MWNSTPGRTDPGEDNAHLFEESLLSDVTPYVLCHSFASIANDLGFTEVTIAGSWATLRVR